MSYSFAVRAGTKAAVLEAAAAEFARVVEQQPIHAADAEQAKIAREQAVTVLPDAAPEGKAFYLSCSGSVTWEGTYPTDHRIIGASISVYATFLPAQ